MLQSNQIEDALRTLRSKVLVLAAGAAMAASPAIGQVPKQAAKGTANAGQSQSRSTQAPSAPSNPTSSTSTSNASPTQTVQASKSSSGEYPADYIPCVFTLRELLGLRLKPVAATLTSSDAEDLKLRLISKATAEANSGAMDPFLKSDFLTSIANQSFEGLTPSQALARVITLLRDAYNKRAPIDQLKYFANNKNIQQLVNLAESQLPMPSDPQDSAQIGKNLVRNLFPLMDAAELLTQLATNVVTALAGVQYFTYEFEDAQKTLAPTILRAAKELETAALSGSDLQKAEADLANEAQQQDIAIQAIVETAREGIAAAFQRPQDVGCAMSTLSWNEMRYAFGRIIANEYIGIQIVVRNLNDKQEFALHDAELSVDTDINGSYGRFFSGRDKLVVRGLSLAQADFTPRNFVVHLAQAVGTVMSAALPVAGTTFKDATGVYNGGFLPGFKSVWTDHSVDQLNLLSDIGFSSSTNYKTVVPKSGSVMFVIFIPAKQFEEGWWVQSCAEHISINPTSQRASASTPESTTPTAPYATSTLPPLATASNVGIDLSAARELCRTYGAVAAASSAAAPSSASAGQPSASEPAPTNPTANQSSGRSGKSSTVLSVAAVPYRKWSPIALSIFRELSWAVVAGAHILETQNQSAITELKCPMDDLGNVLFNKTGTVSCDVTGEGLDKIATLRLRDAQDATDTDTADGPVTVSGDPTKAKVTFQLSKVGNLNKPAYRIYAVTTTGVETFANQTIHLDLNPFETDVNPTVADPTKQTSMQFTLKGFHLDRIAKVELFEGSYGKDTKPLLSYDPDPGATANQASFTLKSSDDDFKKKAGESSGEQLQIVFLVKNSTAVTPADSIKLQSQASS